MDLMKVLLISKKKRINLIKPLEDTIRGFPSRTSAIAALYTITIRMTQNNIFCYIGNIVTNKTLLKLSSGNVKINITKKTLKFHSTRIIPYFFSLLRSKMIRSVINVNFIVPKAIKKKFFFWFCQNLKN